MDTRRCGSTSTETVPARVSTSLRTGRPRAPAFPRGRPPAAGAGRDEGPGPAVPGGVPQRAENPVSPPEATLWRFAHRERLPPWRARGRPGHAESRRGTRTMARTRTRRPRRAGSPTAVVTNVALSAVTPPARAAPAGRILGGGLPGSVGGGPVVTTDEDTPASSAAGRRPVGAHGASISHMYGTVLDGVAVRADAGPARRLAADPHIASVAQDSRVAPDAVAGTSPPWDLDRVSRPSRPLDGGRLSRPGRRLRRGAGRGGARLRPVRRHLRGRRGRRPPPGRPALPGRRPRGDHGGRRRPRGRPGGPLRPRLRPRPVRAGRVDRLGLPGARHRPHAPLRRLGGRAASRRPSPGHARARWRKRWSRGRRTARCPAAGPVRRTGSCKCQRSCDGRPKAAPRSSRTRHVLCKDIGGSS